MICSQCEIEIEDDSKFCRICGAAQMAAISSDDQSDPSVVQASIEAVGPQSASPSLLIWGVLIAVVIIISVLASMIKGMPVNNTLPAGESTIEAVDAAVDASAAAQEAAAAASAAAAMARADVGSADWSYTTSEDKVRGGKTYSATVTSTNRIFQSSPYEAETSMDMMIRNAPGTGTDVLMVVSSGQLMCPSYETCSGTVRFDDGAAREISFVGAADNSSETIFVSDAEDFIARLKKAKHLVVEKTLYQAGNPQFEFDVANLKWDH